MARCRRNRCRDASTHDVIVLSNPTVSSPRFRFGRLVRRRWFPIGRLQGGDVVSVRHRRQPGEHLFDFRLQGGAVGALTGKIMIIDPRFNQLAAGLTGFSTELKPGERVLIDAFDVPDAMVIALVRATRARGAFPYVQLHRARVTREMALGAEEGQYAPLAKVELARMEKMDAYIALRGSDNIFEASDVPSAKVQLVSRLMKPVLDHRVGKTKWVVLRWPSAAMAQQAAMSTEALRISISKSARSITGG